MKTALLAIAALLILAACATEQPARATLPVVHVLPAGTAEDAPAEDGENTLTGNVIAASETRDAMFGTRFSGEYAIGADDVVCDLEAKTLTFRFKNTDTKAWQLDNDVPLAHPADLVGVRLLINQYAANTRTYYMDGQTLFGPNEKFSENCDTDVLAPGDIAVCSLTHVPLRDIYSAGGVNKIVLNVPGAAEDPKVEFVCPQA